ncbi:MAG: sensor domain-containing diguanylate cyclase [Pyrinomonadaceae bacterium]|nr:sensor domain-containing diguanylate cyclase [Pyrinomonadaceae bacterium]
MNISRKYFATTSAEPEKGVATVLALISLIAFAAVFIVASSSLQVGYRLIISSIIAAVYLFAASRVSSFGQSIPKMQMNGTDADPVAFDEEIENKLQALEDASTFFGASLKSSDMFRLVSSRINEMIPFRSIALFLANESADGLDLLFSTGADSAVITSRNFLPELGLAGKVLTSKTPKLDKYIELERKMAAKDDFSNSASTIAAPLFRGENVIGVVQLFSDENGYGESSLKLIEAISVRLAPLLLSTLAFEQNLSNALTDPLTNLPNERAFFLVLENQIAESQRNRDERPLTVLSLDIKNFTEINQRFGHSTGDNILEFSGKIIKNQLRKMDFLARSANDEFLIILPTANEETSGEILERLVQTFNASPYGVAADNHVVVQLNSGYATFYRDGETAADLLERSRKRKRETKSPGDIKVLKFPQK